MAESERKPPEDQRGERARTAMRAIAGGLVAIAGAIVWAAGVIGESFFRMKIGDSHGVSMTACIGGAVVVLVGVAIAASWRD
jgi:hypothetical protein